MTGPAEFNGAIGLADFLSDLRGELTEASRRAEDGTLKLRVKEVTTTLDVAVSLEKRAEGSVRAKANSGCSPRPKPKSAERSHHSGWPRSASR